MIYIITALYVEARPFIEKYNLKKDEVFSKFQVFSNEKIKLVISGVGRIKASIALTQLLTNAKINENDFIINFGFCASTNTENKLLDIVMINKIKSAYSKQSFYPEMLYKHKFLEGALLCYDEIIEKYQDSLNEKNYIDMESMGFFETANYFFKRDKIIVLKIVSDILHNETSKREILELNKVNLLINACEEIFIFLDNLTLFYKKDENDFSILEENFIKKMRQNLKLSDTMYYESINLLKYLKLSKKDIIEFLKDYEDREVKSKIEGKRYFEDIKKRIID